MINNLGRFWRELEAWSRSNQEKQVINIVMWAEKRRVTWILVSLLLDNISPSRKTSISKHFVRELTRLLWLHDLFYIFRSCLHRIELVELHLWDDQNLIFYGVGCTCVTSGSNGGIGRLDFGLRKGLWLLGVNNFRVGSVNYEWRLERKPRKIP